MLETDSLSLNLISTYGGKKLNESECRLKASAVTIFSGLQKQVTKV